MATKKAAPEVKKGRPARTKTIEFAVDGNQLLAAIHRVTAALERSESAGSVSGPAMYDGVSVSPYPSGALGGNALDQASVKNYANSPQSNAVPVELMIDEVFSRISLVAEGASFIASRLGNPAEGTNAVAASAPTQSYGYTKDRLFQILAFINRIESDLKAIQAYTLA